MLVMACLPVQLPAWLPWWLEYLISPSDSDNFWDNREEPPNLSAGDTVCEPRVIKPPASAPDQVDIDQSQSVKASLGKHLPTGISINFIS